MPKEQKKRGRRALEKRRQDDEDQADVVAKRARIESQVQEDVAEHSNEQNEFDSPFYGLLTEEEQDYFRHVDEMLELNQFADDEERSLFLENVFREVDGKELKIFNSQSSSRLMERLILVSSAAQLKALFQKVLGNFLHLVQHRFASHCCEALFIQSALGVSEDDSTLSTGDVDSVMVSMENLFLYALNDLEGNFGYLATDAFASHVLRLLLVILSGRPLSGSAAASTLRSKAKERIHVGASSKAEAEILPLRAVPESFMEALDKICGEILGSSDTNTLRSLTTHQVGSPVLQLILEIELSEARSERAKSEQSLLRRIFPKFQIKDDPETIAFVQGLVYDSVGSHFLEKIVQLAPGKLFKILYRDFFIERLSSLARNDTASFVVIRIIERLSKEDLDEVVASLTPESSKIFANFKSGVLRTLIERCHVRGSNMDPIARSLEEAFGTQESFLSNILGFSENDPILQENESKEMRSKRLQGSLLAQTMLSVSGKPSRMVYDSITSLPGVALKEVSQHSILSRVVQTSLTADTTTSPYRRRVINLLAEYAVELALDSSGSHVLDSVWEGASGFGFLREKIAEILLGDEETIKSSYSGRIVWRNWMLDLYKRKKAEWIRRVKESERSKHGSNGTDRGPQTGIAAARQRFAAKQNQSQVLGMRQRVNA